MLQLKVGYIVSPEGLCDSPAGAGKFLSGPDRDCDTDPTCSARQVKEPCRTPHVASKLGIIVAHTSPGMNCEDLWVMVLKSLKVCTRLWL